MRADRIHGGVGLVLGAGLFFAVCGAAGAAETNEAWRAELTQCQAHVRVLTENLAIARTESELFQKRWAEAQARVQMLGASAGDAGQAQLQRQLVESLRALYVAQTERQELTEQLRRLLAALETDGGGLSGEVARTKTLLAATEQASGSARPAAPEAGRLDDARVLDVNGTLRVVVLNVGAAQGARVGMPVVVLRADRVVAELRVIDVRRSICGALVERVDKGVTVTAGDTARVTKS